MKIDCLSFSKQRIPRHRVTSLCLRLFRRFASHREVRKHRPLSKGTADVTLVFVGRTQARKLNRVFRRRDCATDILSFSFGHGEGLGELVLCVPVIKAQAKKHGLSFHKELDYLVIHGFLHLIGYDHEKSRKEEEKMMRLQDRLFEKLSKD